MASGGNDPFNFSELRKALPSAGVIPGDNFDRFFDYPVKVSGYRADLQEIKSFEEAGFGDTLLENIQNAGYDCPLPIQQHAIPYIQNDRDVIGHSVTGSGKTAAYILPILDLLSKKKDDDLTPIILHGAIMPRAVALLPTRELAIQVKDEFEKFVQGLDLKVELIYGGGLSTIPEQLASVRSGCDILVATPGRLKNFLRRDEVCMAKCRYLILDEADRMLDMDFEPAIRYIIERGLMPAKNLRQTLLFSATFPDPVQKICTDFLEEHVFIQVGKIGAANRDIVQEVIKTRPPEKLEKLLEILVEELKESPEPGQPWTKKILVFVPTRNDADTIHDRLKMHDFSVAVIHGKMEQPSREESLNGFKDGTCAVLVATPVAGRGLDIKEVDLVINYDLPPKKQIDEYVQRIGRTGRLGNAGRAISFFDPVLDKKFGNELLNVLKEAQQNIPDWFLQETGAHNGPRFMDHDF